MQQLPPHQPLQPQSAPSPPSSIDVQSYQVQVSCSSLLVGFAAVLQLG